MESKYLYKQSGIIDCERIIAKIYCFVLPFRMITQLSFLKSIFYVSANYFPFVFHLLGLVLWGFSEGWKPVFGSKRDLVRTATRLVVWLNISSIIMAGIIQISYGNQGSENAFQGIMGMLIYFTQYLLMFLYNYRVFKLLTLNEIRRILHAVCIVLLAIGYMQVLVINGIGALAYDRINFLGVLNRSTSLYKLPLTGSEGASAGSTIAILVLPFLFSQIVIGKRKYIWESLLWLVPIFYTNSTNAYILVAVELSVFLCILIVRSENRRRGIRTAFLVIFCLLLLFLVMRAANILDDAKMEQIRYLLFEKATDNENGSTVSRTVPLIVNWGAFTEYPFLGVGNGLQGYFYEKYFPSWALNQKGSDVGVFLAKSQEGISNGGVFIPSLLSGYGIVGCVLIFIFVWKCIKENKRNKEWTIDFYYIYLLGGIAVFITGFQGDFYGRYYIWFLLSIPFMSPDNNTSEKINDTCGRKLKEGRYIRQNGVQT